MNPLPVIRAACAKIDEALGKYGDEEKKAVGLAELAALSKKWIVPVSVTTTATCDAFMQVNPDYEAWAKENGYVKVGSLEAMGQFRETTAGSGYGSDQQNGGFTVSNGLETATAVADPPVAAGPNVGPWPLEATVTVFANCINPRLLRAKLEDGRDVTFEIRRGCKYRRGQPVKCRRVSAEMAGNPMYAPM